MGRYSVRIGMTLDQMLGELTEAAWQTAKPHISKDKDKVRAAVAQALKDVLRRDMIWSDICGLAVVCTDSTAFEPWSSGDDGASVKHVLGGGENTAWCGERD